MEKIKKNGKKSIKNQITWDIGDFLGAGTFATGYCDYSNYNENTPSNVIKTIVDTDDCDRLEVEVIILNKIYKSTLSTSKLFPTIVDVLYHKEDCKDIIAIKLSPRGISVPAYLRAIRHDKKRFTALISLLGPAIITTLDYAHNRANVAHCDVKRENILLLPPVYCMKTIESFHGDVVTEPDAIFNIQLNDCAFILYDWGEAVFLNSSNSKIH